MHVTGTVGCKKAGNENFPNVNLVLSICQLIVCLTNTCQIFFKMSLNFNHNSNLCKKVSRYEKIVKMCQFYSDSSRFFFATNCIQTNICMHLVIF
jgi:hypothetical protein